MKETILNVVFALLAVFFICLSYYFYIRAKINAATEDAVNNAEQDDKTATEKMTYCKIVSSTGFDDNEICMLEEYMRQELSRLKRMAASIRLVDAFMKE